MLQALGDTAEEFEVVTNRDGLTDLLALPEHSASRLYKSGLWAVRIPRRCLQG